VSEQPSLWDGPARDAALARVAGAVVTALPDATRARDAIVASHAKVRQEWVARCREAMVALWKARQAANERDHHGQLVVAVTGDDASQFLELAGADIDKRCLAAVFLQPRGLWTKVGMTTSKRRHATLQPLWALSEGVR
jgi:hypothetical protein